MRENDADIDGQISPSLQKRINKLIEDEAEQRQHTWSYYQKIKKEDPDRYWRSKTQQQMVSDASALGEAFQDGSFND
ncbi:hypothetical protein IVA88_16705 [Bradyrhizobium sp. 149]|uniref:hypothetical protein n=1 Tax=Bradyrhizobium sp. 149 TaxID=2782624 RepID=UPI001FF9FDFD|nr:hypothetical protein [Bradyrhizobium sp. 149]MCK1653060.1 hypothetical protein [Bradyrhizobium sp. 149]